MRFASGLAALLLLTSAPARANEEPRETLDPDDDPHASRKSGSPDGKERRKTTPAQREHARAAIADHLVEEMAAIERTLATVGEKLSVAEATRLRRVHAAYRVLHTPMSSEASATDRMASARRRAAARMLLERDADERKLLVSEAAHLRAAQTKTIEASAKVPSIALPQDIERPAEGSIVRRFGTLEHERSKTTLSRRGIDFEVERHAVAAAPADGVVRYAGPIRGLDHGVILDHGDYLTVVAKLSELAIPIGTRVERGDRVGRAANRRVYLEVRAKVGAGGLPIDPAPLLDD